MIATSAKRSLVLTSCKQLTSASPANFQYGFAVPSWLSQRYMCNTSSQPVICDRGDGETGKP